MSKQKPVPAEQEQCLDSSWAKYSALSLYYGYRDIIHHLLRVHGQCIMLHCAPGEANPSLGSVLLCLFLKFPNRRPPTFLQRAVTLGMEFTTVNIYLGKLAVLGFFGKDFGAFNHVHCVKFTFLLLKRCLKNLSFGLRIEFPSREKSSYDVQK